MSKVAERFKILCIRCKQSQRKFINPCNAPSCCLYLDSEIVNKLKIPQKEVSDNIQLLTMYKATCLK